MARFGRAVAWRRVRVGGAGRLAWIACLALICLAPLAPASASDGRKVALVVGNAAYDKVSALANPKRDAADLADRLRDLGFTVAEVFEGDLFGLNRAADRFVADAKGADLALFYFAGHGVQLFDRNFLLARDADPGALKKAGDLGLDLTAFAARLRGSGAVRVAMLIDACRDNPLPMETTIRLLTEAGEAPKAAEARARSTAGLAGLEAPKAGPAGVQAEMLTFFAAQPGHVSFDGAGENSYFMEGLEEALSKKDRPLSEVFRAASLYVRTVTKGGQVPQVVSDWTADLGLGAAKGARVAYESGSKDISPQDQALIAKAAGGSQKLHGDFIVRASWDQSHAWNLSPSEEARLKAIHERAYAMTLTYDLDRDGDDESITVYNEVNVVQVVVEKQGVRATISNCRLPNEITRIEFALKDIDGDRRPEVLIDYELAEPGDDGIGRFCILDFTGFKNLAELRRANTGRFDLGESLFRTLLETRSGRSITLTNDGTIRMCMGTGCPDFDEFGYADGRFTQRESFSEKTRGAAALPFADERERARNLRRTADAAALAVSPRGPAPVLMQRSSPASSATGEAVARFIEATLFRPGPQATEQLRGLYGAEVEYFGKPRVALRQVLADKERYFKTWPERDFRLDRATLAVNEAGGLVDVSFSYTFQVSGARGTRSGRGIANFRLRPIGGGRYVILAEGGRTL